MSVRMSFGLCFLVVACALVVGPSAFASGSVGPGGGKTAARAEYAQGKALVFRELVCRNCPVQRRDFNRDQARRLNGDLEAALDVIQRIQEGGSDAIRTLCGGEEAGCIAKLQAVRYYLNRRYKLERDR